ncbi:MAG: hypothetical protein WC878_06965 [Candidatus Paceibacterota bacterium]|jgi:hypothetical protein
MDKNKKINKITLLFAIADIVLISLYGLLFFTVKQTNVQTAEIYSSLYRRASDKGILLRLEKTLKETASQRALLDDYLVTPSETLTFIEQIEDLGKKSQTDVLVTSLSNPKKKGDPFLLDFTARGSFQNMNRLFSLVEAMPFRVSIKEISLSAEEKEKESAPIWNASFKIVLESYQG